MLSGRTRIVWGLAGLSLLAQFVVDRMVYERDPEVLWREGQTVTLGPMTVQSAYFKTAVTEDTTSDGSGRGEASILVGWGRAGADEPVLGTMRVRGIWSGGNEPWTDVASVCRHLVERYARSDGLPGPMRLVGGPASKQYECALRTVGSDRKWRYVFDTPAPRCHVQGLVFALTDDATSFFRFQNMTSVKLAPGAHCHATRLAYTKSVTAGVLLLACAGGALVWIAARRCESGAEPGAP